MNVLAIGYLTGKDIRPHLRPNRKLSPALREEGFIRHMSRLERNAQRALRNAKRRGELPADVSPRAKATQLMATGMGLMVVGKTNLGRNVLETIVEAAFAELSAEEEG